MRTFVVPIMSDVTETGWDRLKALFSWRDGEQVPEELQYVSAAVLAGSFVGFLFGGMIGARQAGDKYILLNHSTKFSSSMQAQRELHGAAVLGFMRQGSRWGWKVAVFTGIFSGALTLLSVYREKDDALNYVAAGALTGASFRVSWGLKPAIGGAVLGTLVSLPAGVLMQGLDRVLIGREQRDKMLLEKREARRRRETEWQLKLESTGSLIGALEEELESKVSAGGLQDCYKLGSDSETSSSRQVGPESETSSSRQLGPDSETSSSRHPGR